MTQSAEIDSPVARHAGRGPHFPIPVMVSPGVFQCGTCGGWLEPTPDGRDLWHNGAFPVHEQKTP